jgi:hypothetical protein
LKDIFFALWQSTLDSAKSHPKSICRSGREAWLPCPTTRAWDANMITAVADPFNTLLDLQRALEARTASDWLSNQTASQGPFPPINVFQHGDDILAIIELPGIDKNDVHIQAKENTIRISGRKVVAIPRQIT